MGIIFDLDGTLVDSRLDFTKIRAALGLPQGEPILEAIERISDPQQRRHMHQILIDHEMEGANIADLMPGVRGILDELDKRGMRVAIFTRNARPVTTHTLERLGIQADHVIAREDAPPKPDPSGLLEICSAWTCQTDHVLYVGDYLYDLEAGKRAGIKTVLYSPTEPDFAHDAEWVVSHFDELLPLCEKLFGPLTDTRSSTTSDA